MNETPFFICGSWIQASVSRLFCSVSILLTPLYSKAQENFIKYERAKGKRGEGRSTQENVSRGSTA